MKSNGQSSIEFIILVGAAMVFFIGFMVYLESNISEKDKESMNFAVTSLATAVRGEIELASQASEGYSRTFTLPEKIIDKDYGIALVENSIYVHTLDGRYALSLPVEPVNGSVMKGNNVIRKQNGGIYLN